jgi:DNA-directed RNA polymerase subunit H (RpoH/RPB5)
MLRDRGCARVARGADVRAALDAAPAPALTGRGGPADYDVYVHGEERVGVKYARAVLERAGGARAVVVSLEGPTPFTRKECEGRPIEFFRAAELCANVTRHALVPRHERVDAPPAGVAREQLPRIHDTDPVVRYHAWPCGAVVRVWRVFGGHEPIPYFRVVGPAGG